MLKEEFGDNTQGQKQTYDLCKVVKNGLISVDDEERSRRPSTGTTTEYVARV
jgi:hypothetical protein